MSGDHPVHLPLSMSAAIDNGSAHFDLGVTVEPLLAQHSNECDEGGSQTGGNDRLGVDTVESGPFLGGGTRCTGWGLPRLGTGRDRGSFL